MSIGFWILVVFISILVSYLYLDYHDEVNSEGVIKSLFLTFPITFLLATALLSFLKTFIPHLLEAVFNGDLNTIVFIIAGSLVCWMYWPRK